MQCCSLQCITMKQTYIKRKSRNKLMRQKYEMTLLHEVIDEVDDSEDDDDKRYY